MSATVTIDLKEFDRMRDQIKGQREDLLAYENAVKRVYGLNTAELFDAHEKLKDSESRSNINNALRSGKF